MEHVRDRPWLATNWEKYKRMAGVTAQDAEDEVDDPCIYDDAVGTRCQIPHPRGNADRDPIFATGARVCVCVCACVCVCVGMND